MSRKESRKKQSTDGCPIFSHCCGHFSAHPACLVSDRASETYAAILSNAKEIAHASRKKSNATS